MNPKLELPHGGTMLLSAVVGSTAYGLNTADSDIDTLGVYAASNRHILGLSGVDAVKNSVVLKDPDQTYHEVGKYISLALAGNPTILELLFLEPEYATPQGQILIENRSKFLGAKRIRDAYGGYATQQALRLKNRSEDGKVGFNSDLKKRTAKHGRHCFRLLLLGYELLTTGSMNLNLADRKEEIFAVGEMAVHDPVGFNAIFETHRARLDNAMSVVPDEPDRNAANEILINLRLSLDI